MDTLDSHTFDPLVLALRFGAALGLGVLLGLERERSKTSTGFAGVRTFGLFALTGAVAAFLDGPLARPALAVGLFAAVAALVVVSYVVSAQRGELGLTTEVSALLAFLVGFLCVAGDVVLAAGLAVASGGVLALKDWLHRVAGHIEPADVEATLKFAIVSVIVLPLVPNESFGPAPLDVVNPYKIWLMVVLISGLNFASYVLVKVVGREHGIGITKLEFLEDDKLRDQYGRNKFGQSCLLSRRLLENGVRFCTVNMFETVFNEITWDIHGSAPFSPIECYSDLVGPMLDKGLSTLLEDLKQRGMLDNTLIVAMGEFGRTPKINPAGGRDHWPQVWSILMAGGGIQGGRVVGKTDEIGAYPVERPVTPAEVVATVYHCLGIDGETELTGPGNRPIPLVDHGVKPIMELV